MMGSLVEFSRVLITREIVNWDTFLDPYLMTFSNGSGFLGVALDVTFVLIHFLNIFFFRRLEPPNLLSLSLGYFNSRFFETWYKCHTSMLFLWSWLQFPLSRQRWHSLSAVLLALIIICLWFFIFISSFSFMNFKTRWALVDRVSRSFFFKRSRGLGLPLPE